MNILHLLGGRRLLASTNATRLAEVLLGSAVAFIRCKLGEMAGKEIRLVVAELVNPIEINRVTFIFPVCFSYLCKIENTFARNNRTDDYALRCIYQLFQY